MVANDFAPSQARADARFFARTKNAIARVKDEFVWCCSCRRSHRASWSRHPRCNRFWLPNSWADPKPSADVDQTLTCRRCELAEWCGDQVVGDTCRVACDCFRRNFGNPVVGRIFIGTISVVEAKQNRTNSFFYFVTISLIATRVARQRQRPLAFAWFTSRFVFADQDAGDNCSVDNLAENVTHQV